MSCTWEQPLWLGDIRADKDYSLTIDDGVTPTAVTITKGSWWANCLVFWAWALDQAGLTWSYTMTVDSPGSITITPVGTVLFTFDLTGLLPYELADTLTGGLTNSSAAWTTSHAFLPSFPISTFDVGSMIYGATSERAMSGTAYTVVGVGQARREIEMQFDYATLTELEKWRSLWDIRLSRARSCTFWHGNLPTTFGLYLDDIGACDQLIAEAAPETWRGQRTVEYRNYAARDDGPVVYLRRPNIPLNEPDIQTWYIPPAPAW
jgi:hypothetical protein